MKAKWERCKDGSPIWRSDSYDEELDVDTYVYVELGDSSSQTQHKPLDTRRDPNVDRVFCEDVAKCDVLTDGNETVSTNGDEDLPQQVQQTSNTYFACGR